MEMGAWDGGNGGCLPWIRSLELWARCCGAFGRGLKEPATGLCLDFFPFSLIVFGHVAPSRPRYP